MAWRRGTSPPFDHLAPDIAQGLFTSALLAFSLICMQVVFEVLVAQELAAAPARSAVAGEAGAPDPLAAPTPATV